MEGGAFPLGITWIPEERAFNFALYAKNAERVTLLFFREDDLVHPYAVFELNHLVHKSGRIWHFRIPRAKLGDARYYAYTVTGPRAEWPQRFHCYDPEKLLVDPYAQAIHFPPSFDREAARKPGSNLGRAPLGVLIADEPPFDWGDDRRVHHDGDLVIYELHIKGFTRRANSGVTAEKRGTYAGVIEKIPYLKDLGVTAVELLPVYQFDPQEGNYWGYMPLNFFSPHEGYSSQRADAHREFREMVKALHKADIEVLLDVVYNHTGEGDHTGPIYSFRGIDNSTYYLRSDDPKRPYQDHSGTGNTLHCANHLVRRMIVDSLRYWVTEMHVDGFRFDLASVLTRNGKGQVDELHPPMIGEIRADPVLGRVRLIAEPWDAGGLYQLGRDFPGRRWFQWNGKFRDDVRRFVRGDEGLVGPLMYRLYGSDDIFPDDRFHSYHPYQSVNFVTCHDGFTLYDLVSYEKKCNWANGHQNTDGTDCNYSWNCGVEGDTTSAEILALRKQQVKNFATILFLSNGTPMMVAGDEFLQSQGGNNNPYNQDNETTWLDWSRVKTHADVHRFFKRMIAFRKSHRTIARSRFWREDVRWYGPSGPVDWSLDSREIAFYLHGGHHSSEDLYVMINGSAGNKSFLIGEGLPGEWKRVIDTARPSPDDIVEPGREIPLTTLHYPVAARSIVVLTRNRTPTGVLAEA